MDVSHYVSKKAGTVRRLFYYRVVLNLIRLKHQLYAAISRPTKRYELAIIDDNTPNIIAGFRGTEFSYLLKEIGDSAVFSIIGSKVDRKRQYEYFYIKSIRQFEASKKIFVRNFNLSPGEVNPFFSWTKINSKLIYVVFLTNAYYLADYIEKQNTRFILELYPGGSFCTVTEGPCYDQLKRVLASPMLEKVIVTQKNSLQFLLDNQLCDEDKIVFIYGVILSEDFLEIPEKQVRYKVNKDTVDICFTAAKYMPKGLDKGYDIFIEIAHMLLSQSDIFRFHIVGGFNEDDIQIDKRYAENFHFYGYLAGPEFTEHYKDKDIFISPSRANTLAKGAFDGFPTAACAEAGLHGLCLLLSDPLGLNMVFSNGIDTIIPQNNAKEFAEIIINLADNPENIYRIGEKGKHTIQEHFGHKAQLQTRLDAIKRSLGKIK